MLVVNVATWIKSKYFLKEGHRRISAHVTSLAVVKTILVIKNCPSKDRKVISIKRDYLTRETLLRSRAYVTFVICTLFCKCRLLKAVIKLTRILKIGNLRLT